MIKVMKRSFIIIIILSLFLTMASIQAQDINNDVISLDDDSIELSTDLEDEVGEGPDKTYANLSDEIDNAAGSTVTLTENYTYTGDESDQSYKEGIHISKDLTIVGINNPYIDGNGEARGFYIESGCNVILENLTIRNCHANNWDDGGGIYLCENSNLTIRNCILKGNTVEQNYGGAIYASSKTKIEIYDSILDGDNVGDGLYTQEFCNVVLDNVTIKNIVNGLSYYNNPGIRLFENSNLTLRKCSLSSDSSERFVLIQVDEYSNLEIYDTILDCNGLVKGLDISSFCNVSLDNVTIKNCYYDDNGVYLCNSNLTMINCSLSASDSSGYGALIRAYMSNVESYDSVFDCKGVKKGLDICYSTAYLDNVTVKNCPSGSYGIDSYYSDNLVLKNSVLSYDTATDSTSSLFNVFESHIEIYNSTLDGNNKIKGLYINSYDDYSAEAILDNVTIKNCYSDVDTVNSAGIYLGANSNLTIRNSLLINNKVHNSNGGAIFGSTNTSIDIFNTTFENNIAERQSSEPWGSYKRGMGSAICVNRASVVSLKNSTFRGNDGYCTTILVISYDETEGINQSSLSVDNCLFENNKAYINGAIYLDEFSKGQFFNSVFKNNSATGDGGILVLDTSKSALVKNCTFEENSAIYGGGIAIFGFENVCSDVSIIDCTFYKNTVSSSGGAIFSVSGRVNLSNSIFEDNKSLNNGGAILISDNTVIAIDGSTFKNNRANFGGAIFSMSTLTVTNSNFIANGASSNGGAFYSKNGNNNIANCIFDANTAVCGGGVCSSEGSLTIDASTFKNNVADYGGGLHTLDNVKVTNTNFINNKGTKNAGAIYSKSQKVTSAKCTYSGNAGGSAMDVYVLFSAKLTPSKLYWGDKVSVQFSSLWNVPFPQKVKVDLSGPSFYTTKWVNTNSKGILTFTPTLKAVGKYTVTFKLVSGPNFSKTINVISCPGKVVAKKVSAKYKAKKYFKATVKNSRTNMPVAKVSVKLKIFTGKKSKTYTVKTDNNGVAKYKVSKLSRGKHAVKITSGEKYITFKASSTIKIK